MNDRSERPGDFIMITPALDTDSPRLRAAKECLKRWAPKNGYRFVDPEPVEDS